ncbi:MAG: hypothetical protein ACE1Z0_02745 [Acidimicrobiia bacterium]
MTGREVSRNCRRQWAVLMLAGLMAACELTEVAIPPSDPIVIVQAILRPDLDRQWVIVERSLTGAEERQSTPGDIPFDRPQLPIVGASVTVENLSQSFPVDLCGPAEFAQNIGPGATLGGVDGVYWGPIGCPAMSPGDRLLLTVVTPDSVVVTGETVVTGVDGMFIELRGDSIALPDSTALRFDRDVDTLRAEVAPIVGRMTQVDVRFDNGLNTTRRVTSLFVDSTSLTLPGTLQDLFRGGTGDPIFQGGRFYTMAVAFGDQNYFDFIRSANGDVTGTGFINHLKGGVGVFGNLVASTAILRVVAEADDPREGPFRMQGTIQGGDVDLLWESYLSVTENDTTDFSAFIEGEWFLPGILDESAHGFFVGNRMQAEFDHKFVNPFDTIEDVPARKWTIVGEFSTGPWTVFVRNALNQTIGTLQVTR